MGDRGRRIRISQSRGGASARAWKVITKRYLLQFPTGYTNENNKIFYLCFSLLLLARRRPVYGVPLYALDEPVDALGHAVAGQTWNNKQFPLKIFRKQLYSRSSTWCGKHHAVSVPDVFRVVLEDGLHLADAHALFNKKKEKKIRICVGIKVLCVLTRQILFISQDEERDPLQVGVGDHGVEGRLGLLDAVPEEWFKI